jgi:D-alanine-D-alanine ligase
MRIGLVYDRFGDMAPPAGAPDDWDAEFEPEATIATLEAAIRQLGFEPVRVGNPDALLRAIAGGGPAVDAAVNIAEGYGSRNREAFAPVLLEMAGIPCVGSDALTLSVTLDKHLSKLLISTTPVRTPAWRVVGGGPDGEWPGGESPAGLEPEPLRPARGASHRPLAPSHSPVIVKPRYEGTAKGISRTSRCDTIDAARAEVARQRRLYAQDLIVEAFVDGAEYTVAVVGEPPVALPVLQRATDRATGIGVHALEMPGRDHLDYDIAGDLTPDLERALQDAAVLAHKAFECRDFSRTDFRVDPSGALWFLEINPLPTFAPDGTFAIIAELAGRPYDDFLADVLGGALDRIRKRTDNPTSH